jgi:2-oxoglutarate ferredoxin oxidoreductase subunit alpha
VSYDPLNHENMVRLRAEKIERIADDIPELEVLGPQAGELLVLGWGSTYGAIRTAVEDLQQEGASVASAHLRYLNPLPRNLGAVLDRFDKILVPEMNSGQLRLLLRARFLKDIAGQNKIQGQPFKTSEISERVRSMLSPGSTRRARA